MTDTTNGDSAHIAADNLRATVAKQAARIKELEAELAEAKEGLEIYRTACHDFQDAAHLYQAHNAAMREALQMMYGKARRDLSGVEEYDIGHLCDDLLAAKRREVLGDE